MIISRQIAEINGCKLTISKEYDENEQDYFKALIELEVAEKIVDTLLHKSVYIEDTKEDDK